MERFLQTLSGNKKALKRLEHILNHTGQSLFGETLYVTTDQAAEVYAILFIAWSAGAVDLAQLMDGLAYSADGQVISRATIRAVTGDVEEAKEYAPIGLPDGTTEIDLEINLT